MAKNNLAKAFLLLLLAAVMFACYKIYLPFLDELLIAAILASIFYTPYAQLAKLFRGRRFLASFIMCVLIIALIVVPLFNFLSYTANRSIEAYGQTVEYVEAGKINELAKTVSNNAFLRKINYFGFGSERFHAEIYGGAEKVKSWVLSASGSMLLASKAATILSETANFIFSVALVFLSMFFFFADGQRMVEKLMYWTPLPNKYDKEIFKKFKDVSYSTIFSTFITAIAQGIIGAIGFLIIGFPAFFTSIALAFASIIPYVGTAIIWLPIGGYLLIIGKIWQGIFLLIWGSMVVGNSDNVIRTYLIKDKAGVHPLFIFFAILGGLSLFGFWGIIFGPLIISLAITILHIYEMEYESVLER